MSNKFIVGHNITVGEKNDAFTFWEEETDCSIPAVKGKDQLNQELSVPKNTRHCFRQI